MSVNVWRAGVSSLSVLLLGVIGCGLDDYENRMRGAQERVKRYEEENLALDGPLAMPSRANQLGLPMPIFQMFLRPPKGINLRPDRETDPRNRLFYTYRAGKTNTPIPIAMVEVAFTTDAKDFPGDVMRCFPTPAKQSTRDNTRNPPPPRKPIRFKSAEFEDGQYFYSIHLWQEGKTEVAIAYLVHRNQRQAAMRPIDLSLDSFAAGPEAANQPSIQMRTPLMVTPGRR